jgi:glyoxylase-like metal-dependent hydrolase (beta-lactamase superfamily II)
MLHHLTSHLFWVEDSCTIYGIQRDDGLLLIDCGTDLTAADLQTHTGGTVEQILLTHFHRDQCAAAHQWQQQGVSITLPFAERRFFEESDLLKAAYDIYNNYTAYYPGRGPLQDLRADHYAYDYTTLTWQELAIEVVPLPGHTFGSVGYLFTVDGQRMLACGDLMSAPGKLRDYFWSQWRYMDFQAHVNLLESLATVEKLGVDWILPGHGAPFAATPQAFADLRQPLMALYELFYAKPYTPYRPQFRQITPHVYEVTNSMANSYVVQVDEYALLIDCGYTSGAPITANPHRFIDHLLPYLESDLGIQRVEWFLPSHYHDDHLAGYPALQARYGTQVASSPELKDILAHPERYEMPCLLPQGIEVHQVVERGAAFHWRGIDFFIEQHPGQTLYHHLIFFEVDGARFLAIGDNISGLSFREQRDHIHSFIPKNRTPVTSYTDMPRQILERNPDFLLTGHGGAVVCERAQVERWQEWMMQWQQHFVQILDQPHPNLGMDPHWIEFYPYKVRVEPGAIVDFQVRITNHEAATRTCRLRFRSVAGVQLDPGEVQVDALPGQVTTVVVTVRFPTTFTTHSLPVVADVTWDGRRLGEMAEAIGYW